MFQSFAELNQWVINHPTDKVKVSLQRLLSSGAGAEGVMRGIPADYARRYALVQRLKYASDGTPSDLTPEEQRTVAENTIAAARAELLDIQSSVDAIQPVSPDEPIAVTGVKLYHSKSERFSESFSNPIGTLEVTEVQGSDIPNVTVTIKAGCPISSDGGNAINTITGAKGVPALLVAGLNNPHPAYADGLTKPCIWAIGTSYFNGWNIRAFAVTADSACTVFIESHYNTHEPGELSQHYAIAIADARPTSVTSATPRQYTSDIVFTRSAQCDVLMSGWEWFPTLTNFVQNYWHLYWGACSARVPTNDSDSFNNSEASTASAMYSLFNSLHWSIPWFSFGSDGAAAEVWEWLREKVDRTTSALDVLESMPIQ